MKQSKFNWLIGAVIVVSAIIIPIVVFFPQSKAPADVDPWDNVPLKIPHTDHSAIIQGPFGGSAAHEQVDE